MSLFPSIDCNVSSNLAKAICLFLIAKDAFSDIFIAKLASNNRDLFQNNFCKNRHSGQHLIQSFIDCFYWHVIRYNTFYHNNVFYMLYTISTKSLYPVKNRDKNNIQLQKHPNYISTLWKFLQFLKHQHLFILLFVVISLRFCSSNTSGRAIHRAFIECGTWFSIDAHILLL